MSFWGDHRVCVTGGAGFLGSFVVEELARRGAGAIIVPRSAAYDLRERDAILRLFADTQPTMIIHLAGMVGGIGANMRTPGSFFYGNLMMGVQLIEEARKAGIEKFVALGTICAYPKLTPVPFREDDLWSGYPEETNAPYGLAKKMLLVQLQAYRQQYGYRGIYLMPVNLYGPRDNFDLESGHVIPVVIRKMIEARDAGAPTITLWGDGSPTREFLYVEDCARGILTAAERYDGADPVNLGAGCEIRIRDLAEMIRREVGFTGEIMWDTSKPNGQPRRMLDTSRAKALFGWEAEVDFFHGLRRTVQWWESHRHARLNTVPG